jgi:hypothetical protein
MFTLNGNVTATIGKGGRGTMIWEEHTYTNEA